MDAANGGGFIRVWVWMAGWGLAGVRAEARAISVSHGASLPLFHHILFRAYRVNSGLACRSHQSKGVASIVCLADLASAALPPQVHSTRTHTHALLLLLSPLIPSPLLLVRCRCHRLHTQHRRNTRHNDDADGRALSLPHKSSHYLSPSTPCPCAICLPTRRE